MSDRWICHGAFYIGVEFVSIATPKPLRERFSVLAIFAFVFAFIFPPLGMALAIAAFVRLSTADVPFRGRGMAVAAFIVGAFFVTIGIMGLLSFQKFTKQAKAAEARMNVRDCWRGAHARIEAGHPLPETGGWTPAALPTSERYAYSQALFAVSPWKDIGFQTFEAGFYQYRFINDGGRFVCLARGNLDDDDVYSLFELTGAIVPGANGKVPPEIRVENELE